MLDKEVIMKRKLLLSNLVNGWLVGLIVCCITMWTPLLLPSLPDVNIPLSIGIGIGALYCGFRYTNS